MNLEPLGTRRRSFNVSTFMKLLPLLLIGAAGLFTACESPETDAVDEGPVSTSAQPGVESVSTVSEPVKELQVPNGSLSARFFDEEFPKGSMSVDRNHYTAPEELLGASDLAFIGTIVDSTQAVLIDGPSRADSTGTVIEYDGIVFRIDELLAGVAPDDSGRVTIAHPAISRAENQELMRVELTPIEVVKEGLEAVQDGRLANQSYLVFAVYSRLPGQVLIVSTHKGLTELTETWQSVTYAQQVRNCATGDCSSITGSICEIDPNVTCELPDGGTFDDRWVATVTLECGSVPSKRRIAAIDAETAGYGQPGLLVREQQSGAGRFTAWPVVGDEVDAEGLFLSWSIQTVLLGPWPVDDVIDICDDPLADPISGTP